MLYHDATILVGLVYTSMLFMVVPLVNALETLDDSLIEAAYDLGGNGWSILRQIVIPHAAPGIAAGAIVVFMLTLGNYLTPTLLGGKNSLWFTEQIYTQFITRFNWEQGAAFGFLLLALSTAIVWLGLQARRPALRRRDAARMIPSLPRGAIERYARCRIRRRVLRVPVPAARGRGAVRVQRRQLSGAAVARIHARLVHSATARAGASDSSPIARCSRAIWTSVVVALLGHAAVRGRRHRQRVPARARDFRGKAALSLAMLAPLVIPGVILGISILAFASRLARLRRRLPGPASSNSCVPGLPLVVAGQFSYIVSIATLTIAARLKRFDMTLEEAALNLGASRAAVLRTVTLPYLRPALIGAAAIAFLMSFENFNTTLMLVGSDPPLTIMMYGRMREGASPCSTP